MRWTLCTSQVSPDWVLARVASISSEPDSTAEFVTSSLPPSLAVPLARTGEGES